MPNGHRAEGEYWLIKKKLYIYRRRMKIKIIMKEEKKK